MKINQRENSGFEKKLFVGAGECKILAINPTRKQLNALLDITPKEDEEEKPEFEYIKEDVEVKYMVDGEDKTTTATRLFVDVWLQEVKTETIAKMRFILTNHVQTSKDGKTRYINQIGQSTWIDEADHLPEWFTHFVKKDKSGNVINTTPKAYRMAMRGEVDLYEFLVKWTDLNIWDVTSDILVSNNKKFWRGDVSEIQQLVPIFGDNRHTVVVQFGVRSGTRTDENNNEEQVEYQSCFTRAFMSGGSIKDFNFYAKTGFANVQESNNYDLKKFIKNVFDEEHGFKDYTIRGYFQAYDPENNPVNAANAVLEEDSVSY